MEIVILIFPGHENSSTTEKDAGWTGVRYLGPKTGPPPTIMMSYIED